MFIILKKLWNILSQKEKIVIFILLLMMIISSVLEIIGISLVLPIIAILAKPELIKTNVYLRYIYNLFNPSSDTNFIVSLSIVLIILYIWKNLFLSFQYYVQSRFIMNKGAMLANKLFSNYLHSTYKYHLNHNSGYLLGNISLADLLSAYMLLPLMALGTELVVVCAVFTMLVSIYPLVTLGLLFAVIVISAIIYFPLKNLNYKLGKIYKHEVLEMNKYAMQGLNSFKESKVRNKENYFSGQYEEHRNIFNKTHALILFLRILPRCLVESLAVSMGLIVLLIMIMNGGGRGDIILTISLFASSAVRLMPSLTRIQNSLTTIKQYSNSFHSLFEDIVDFEVENNFDSDTPLPFNNELKIDSISFAYNKGEDNIFTKFSLMIQKSSSVAFVGATGCGKTTIIDMILGLLKPDSGAIKVDGIDIKDNLSAWQKKIGYVPQAIFLLDDSIKANVAFGEYKDDIDESRVVECLKLAQVYKFIETLPDGVNNVIGENGIRLSGGQRQRIGIARALYHKPELLILDEATSALDNETEEAFIDALNKLKGKLTIIMIAHRLSSVKNCDEVIDLGKV